MRKGAAIFIVLLAIAGIVYGYLRYRPQMGRVEQPKFEVVPVERRTIITTLSATGAIASARESRLTFGVGGVLSELSVAVGDQVEEGQPLATLDKTDLERSVAQAQANLESAQIRLEQTEHPYDQLDIELAQGAVRDAKVALENAQRELSVVRNDPETGETIRSLEYEVAWYETHYGESLRKYEQGRITKERLDLDFSNLMTAKERLATARIEAEMNLAAAENKVAQAKEGLRKAQEDLATILAGPDPDEVTLAQNEVESAQIALDRALENLNKATLAAPFAGVVTSLGAEEGELVAAGAVIIVLADISPLHIDVEVGEMDIGQVQMGQETRITLDAFPQQEIQGSVSAIAPTSSDKGGAISYPVTVNLAPTDLPLRIGMSADVEFITAKRENVLVVPNAAIQLDRITGMIYVEKLVNQERLPVEIQIGMRSEQFSEIMAGLEEGDRVVVPIAAEQGEPETPRPFMMMPSR